MSLQETAWQFRKALLVAHVIYLGLVDVRSSRLTSQSARLFLAASAGASFSIVAIALYRWGGWRAITTTVYFALGLSLAMPGLWLILRKIKHTQQRLERLLANLSENFVKDAALSIAGGLATFLALLGFIAAYSQTEISQQQTDLTRQQTRLTETQTSLATQQTQLATLQSRVAVHAELARILSELRAIPHTLERTPCVKITPVHWIDIIGLAEIARPDPGTRSIERGRLFIALASLPVCAQIKAGSSPPLVYKSIPLDHALARHAYYPGAQLRGAQLAHADLTDAQLGSDTDPKPADLREAMFDYAILDRADLRNSDLRDSSFKCASLAKADLAGAILKGTRFHGVDLRSVRGLTEASLSEASGDSSTILPSGIRRLPGWSSSRSDCKGFMKPADGKDP